MFLSLLVPLQIRPRLVRGPEDLGRAICNGMDIQELKQLLKGSTSVLILDNGQPSFVIVDYQVYKNLITTESTAPLLDRRQNTPPSLSAQELEMIERLNKEILALKNQIEAEERSSVTSGEDT